MELEFNDFYLGEDYSQYGEDAFARVYKVRLIDDNVLEILSCRKGFPNVRGSERLNVESAKSLADQILAALPN